jgi:hypothetical protein
MITKTIEIDPTEMEDCLKPYRNIGDRSNLREASLKFDAAVFINEKGNIEIYHQDGGAIECIPVVADAGPFAG